MPIPAYVHKYKENIATLCPNCHVTDAINSMIDEYLCISDNNTNDYMTPYPVHDICLLIHSIYFTSDIIKLIKACCNMVKSGGLLIIVLANDLSGYTGKLCHNFCDAYNISEYTYAASATQRHNIFGLTPDGVNTSNAIQNIQSAIADKDFYIELFIEQDTRIYGHSIGDLIASAFISDITNIGDITISDKIDFIRDFIENNSRYIDLSLEIDGIRHGMISVSQPQLILAIKRK